VSRLPRNASLLFARSHFEDIGPRGLEARTSALSRLPEFVRPREQIAERFPHAQRQPALAAMLILIMQHVTALADGLQVARTVVRGIMIEMRRRQIHSRRTDLSQ
jgi:hypothetical protein